MARLPAFHKWGLTGAGSGLCDRLRCPTLFSGTFVRIGVANVDSATRAHSTRSWRSLQGQSSVSSNVGGPCERDVEPVIVEPVVGPARLGVAQQVQRPRR